MMRLLVCRVRITRILIVAGVAGLVLAGCETVPTEDKYVLYREHMPSSILVLPPLNESLDVNASYSYITTLSEPIAEKGYYVFPVGVVAQFMQENGLPTPSDMHNVSLAKLHEIIGADAVLYITLEEFGQKFELLSSTTRVQARAELVDVKTGQVLWKNSVNHAEGSSSGGQGLLADLLTAAVTQVGDTVNDRSHDASVIANRQLFGSRRDGLLQGPLHPQFAVEATVSEEVASDASDATVDEETAGNKI